MRFVFKNNFRAKLTYYNCPYFHCSSDLSLILLFSLGSVHFLSPYHIHSCFLRHLFHLPVAKVDCHQVLYDLYLNFWTFCCDTPHLHCFQDLVFLAAPGDFLVLYCSFHVDRPFGHIFHVCQISRISHIYYIFHDICLGRIADDQASILRALSGDDHHSFLDRCTIVCGMKINGLSKKCLERKTI